MTHHLLPTGTVTFLFTDIVGSTPLWERDPDGMRASLNLHNNLLAEAVTAHVGHWFKTVGDSFQVAFAEPLQAVHAALAGQRALAQAEWGHTGPLKVRMGIHTGHATAEETDYAVAHTLNRVARIMSAAHGGQIILSQEVYDAITYWLPDGITLQDLGMHRMKGMSRLEHLYQVIVADLPTEFPPIQSLEAFKHNLHRQLSTFIGREKELAKVKRLLKETQLLTLLGPGGTGKTRLMLQIAEEVIEDYPDSVWLVELAPLTDPNLIAERVASALTVQEQPGRQMFDTLVDYLRRKELLLLLDNVEHLVRECAAFTEHLLEHCPKLKVLVTGREALFIGGEITLQIPSLSLPQEKQTPAEIAVSEGVQLFLERARSVCPDFELNAQNAGTIAEIVRRLDGIPLALELAAARLRMLTVEQIAARLNDRFRLLTGGRRTALPRQQTLQAMIDWSWNLLDKPERILLRRLSVFSGGWTLEAAQTVAGFDPLDEFAVFDGLEQLINKSLVTAQYPSEAEARYGMLESIRQYAQEKLLEAGDGQESRNQHLACFLALSRQAFPELHRANQKAWLARLQSEHDNFRLALEWSLISQPEAAVEICVGLAEFWDTRGYLREGRLWFDRVLEATQQLPPTPSTVQTYLWSAWLAFRQTDGAVGEVWLERSLTLARQLSDRRGIALAEGYLGILIEHMRGQPDHALEHYEEALRIWRELEDNREIGRALGPLAGRAFRQGDLAEAERIYGESLARFREHGDQREIAGALWNLADVALAQGDTRRAETLASESLAIYRELEDRHGIATVLRTLGNAIASSRLMSEWDSRFAESCRLFRELDDPGCLSETLAAEGMALVSAGELQRGAESLQEALTLALTVSETKIIHVALEATANLVLAQSRYADAVSMFAAAESYRTSIQVHLTRAVQAAHDQALEELQARLGPSAFQEAWQTGQEWTPEKVVLIAFKENP